MNALQTFVINGIFESIAKIHLVLDYYEKKGITFDEEAYVQIMMGANAIEQQMDDTAYGIVKHVLPKWTELVERIAKMRTENIQHA